jgi:hypothetical protein
MVEVKFAPNLERHLSAPPAEVSGATVGEALHAALQRQPRLRGHVLDDHGRLHKHIVVFVNGALIEDRHRLTDPVEPASELFVMQALAAS